MTPAVADIVVKSPRACSDLEIGVFIACVRAGGEVSVQGLVERIRGAAALGFAHRDGLLLGVSALKLPQASYRRRIGSESGTQLRDTQFPYELGWVYVMPDARGKGLSLALSEAVLASSADAGVFATSRTDNNPMHRTLIKLGFQPAGKSFTSGRGKHVLQVFTRDAAQQVHAPDRPTAMLLGSHAASRRGGE
jgi:GNAT superfamily N-acetyltransferase